jgi:hypothetical protein
MYGYYVLLPDDPLPLKLDRKAENFSGSTTREGKAEGGGEEANSLTLPVFKPA